MCKLATQKQHVFFGKVAQLAEHGDDELVHVSDLGAAAHHLFYKFAFRGAENQHVFAEHEERDCSAEQNLFAFQQKAVPNAEERRHGQHEHKETEEPRRRERVEPGGQTKKVHFAFDFRHELREQTQHDPAIQHHAVQVGVVVGRESVFDERFERPEGRFLGKTEQQQPGHKVHALTISDLGTGGELVEHFCKFLGTIACAEKGVCAESARHIFLDDFEGTRGFGKNQLSVVARRTGFCVERLRFRASHFQSEFAGSTAFLSFGQQHRLFLGSDVQQTQPES